MTELETLARDLRDKLRSQWPEDQDRGYNEPLAPGWDFVARHVQQLQREAWIAGRDAAAEACDIEARECKEDGDLDAWSGCCFCGDAIRALEPPAQESGT